jgi:hypothetical protein
MGHCRHGVIPASRKNRRTDLSAPLSVSFAGCGRWNTASTPFRLTRTRDPRPSEIVAPAAMNNASMSTHGTLARTGSAKTACNVLRCLPRINDDTRTWYQLAKQALEKAMAIAPAQFDWYVSTRVPWHRPEDYAHMLEGLRKAGWQG